MRRGILRRVGGNWTDECTVEFGGLDGQGCRQNCGHRHGRQLGPRGSGQPGGHGVIFVEWSRRFGFGCGRPKSRCRRSGNRRRRHGHESRRRRDEFPGSRFAVRLRRYGAIRRVGRVRSGTCSGRSEPMGPSLGFGAAATMGQASSVGTLSVPQTWADAGPAASVPAGPMPVPTTGFGAAPAASTNAPATPKVTFPALVEREADGLQRIGLRATMLPPPLVG